MYLQRTHSHSSSRCHVPQYPPATCTCNHAHASSPQFEPPLLSSPSHLSACLPVQLPNYPTTRPANRPPTDLAVSPAGAGRYKLVSFFSSSCLTGGSRSLAASSSLFLSPCPGLQFISSASWPCARRLVFFSKDQGLVSAHSLQRSGLCWCLFLLVLVSRPSTVNRQPSPRVGWDPCSVLNLYLVVFSFAFWLFVIIVSFFLLLPPLLWRLCLYPSLLHRTITNPRLAPGCFASSPGTVHYPPPPCIFATLAGALPPSSLSTRFTPF